MSNKKVYLAKHVLASGFDVEYVKSNLLRIPGIDIVESGMGISAEDCDALVIVGREDFNAEDDTIVLSKNVIKEFKEFSKEHSEDLVFIYNSVGPADFDDVEDTTPLIRNLVSDEILNRDKDNYNSYGELDIDPYEEYNLLYELTLALDISTSCWEKVPRHHQPAPEYSMPPIPTLEERRLKKSSSEAARDEERQFNSTAIRVGVVHPFNFRLLLLKRK